VEIPLFHDAAAGSKRPLSEQTRGLKARRYRINLYGSISIHLVEHRKSSGMLDPS
jgi:hypothetical protein